MNNLDGDRLKNIPTRKVDKPPPLAKFRQTREFTISNFRDLNVMVDVYFIAWKVPISFKYIT